MHLCRAQGDKSGFGADPILVMAVQYPTSTTHRTHKQTPPHRERRRSVGLVVEAHQRGHKVPQHLNLYKGIKMVNAGAGSIDLGVAGRHAQSTASATARLNPKPQTCLVQVDRHYQRRLLAPVVAAVRHDGISMGMGCGSCCCSCFGSTSEGDGMEGTSIQHSSRATTQPPVPVVGWGFRGCGWLID